MKSKIYEFKPVIYPWSILVTKEFDEDELKEMFDIMGKDDEIYGATSEFSGLSYVTASVNVVATKSKQTKHHLVQLFKPRNIGVGIVCHEALHVTNEYLHSLGVLPARSYDDEHYAYFLQWVANCIWSVLIDNAKEMKGTLLK